MSSERRRSPRIEILGRLHGHIAALDVAVKVREISLGGFSLETAFPFPADAVHDFSLTMGDGSATQVRGRVVRSTEAKASDGSRLYVTGVQFIDDEPSEGDSTIGDIVDCLR
jgi:PilZ domain-containing protein